MSISKETTFCREKYHSFSEWIICSIVCKLLKASHLKFFCFVLCFFVLIQGRGVFTITKKVFFFFSHRYSVGTVLPLGIQLNLSIPSAGNATHPAQIPQTNNTQPTQSSQSNSTQHTQYLAGRGTVSGHLLSVRSSTQTQAGHPSTTPSSKLIGGAHVTSLPTSFTATGSNISHEHVYFSMMIHLLCIILLFIYFWF